MDEFEGFDDYASMLEEWEASYELDGKKYEVTIQMQKPPEGQQIGHYLVVYNNGITKVIGWEQSLKWHDKEEGKSAHADAIGKLVEEHYTAKDSEEEALRDDYGMDNKEQTDPTKPFKAWFKIMGKKFRVRIEPVITAFPTYYNVYTLDVERELNRPEWVVIHDEDSGAWIERDKGETIYSTFIGYILEGL